MSEEEVPVPPVEYVVEFKDGTKHKVMAKDPDDAVSLLSNELGAAYQKKKVKSIVLASDQTGDG